MGQQPEPGGLQGLHLMDATRHVQEILPRKRHSSQPHLTLPHRPVARAGASPRSPSIKVMLAALTHAPADVDPQRLHWAETTLGQEARKDTFFNLNFLRTQV